jgi:hypothetical protein
VAPEWIRLGHKGEIDRLTIRRQEYRQ